MIFFSVWLYACSREVLRELVQLPNTSTTKGILGILGILVSGCPSMSGLVSLTSFPPLFPTHGAKKTNSSHSIAPLPPPVAGLLALTSAITQGQCNEPKPKTPATLRPAADLPRPSADGSQRPGYAPPAQPTAR